MGGVPVMRVKRGEEKKKNLIKVMSLRKRFLLSHPKRSQLVNRFLRFFNMF